MSNQRYINRRTFLSMTLAVSVLTACSGSTPTANTPTTAAATDGATTTPTRTTAAPTTGPVNTPAATAIATARPVTLAPATLRVQTPAGNADDFWDESLPRFTKQFPNVTAERDVVNNYGDALAAQHAAGEAGDVFWCYLEAAFYYGFVGRGATLMLDNLISRDKLDLKPYFPYAIDAMKVGGKMGGLPFKGSPGRVIYIYQKDRLAEAGVKEPDENWTLDDLRSIAQKLTKATGSTVERAGLDAPNDTYYWFRAFGGDILTADGKKHRLDDSATQQGLQFIYDMAWQERSTKAQLPAPPQGQSLWPTQVSVLQQNPGYITIAQRQAGDLQLGMAPPPKGPNGKRATNPVADCICIYSQTKNVDQAWALLQMLTDKESGIRLAETALAKGGSATPGARFDVINDPRLTKIGGIPAADYAKVNQLAFADAMPFVRPANSRGPELNQKVYPLFDQMMRNEKQPSKGLFEEMGAAAQQILDLPDLLA